jgi:hypothetical protein
VISDCDYPDPHLPAIGRCSPETTLRRGQRRRIVET